MKHKKKLLSMALAVGVMVPALAPVQAAEKNVTIASVKFNGMDAPHTVQDMIKPYTTATVDVKYSNGTTKTFPLSYNKLFLSEDKIVDNKGVKISAGTPIDVNGNEIMDNSVPDSPVPYLSDSPDSNSMLKAGDKLYLISHYEYQTLDKSGKSAYGYVPASMTLTQLNQDKTNGTLSVASAKKVDFSGVNGLWIPCNGSTSPWGTHLSSEEYEPDARAFEANPSASNVSKFAKLYFGDEAKANPYFYGFIPEISVNEKGEASVVKHYGVGRFSHEMMQMMPDNRTAYFGDDGGNTTMFMYVADKAKDLSAGTLYAAKFTQTSTENGGRGDLSWVNLGHATDAEIKDYIDQGIKFSDMFETSTEAKTGFRAIKTYASKSVEYLRLRPGMAKAAAFLESRRYAAYMGATSEFNKMEGITVNKKDKKVYIAMSYQEGSMEANSKDPVDDIHLNKIRAGVTYELPLGIHKADTKKNMIDSEFVASEMHGLLVGEDLPQADAYGNTANPDKIANPDNLTYSENLHTLFIGEDSGLHMNNFVWAYNVDTKQLSRVLSVPVGAEATGLRSVDDANGFSYVLSNFQHPGDELGNFNPTAVSRQDLIDGMKNSIGIDKTGGVGYISGLPFAGEAPKVNEDDKNHGAKFDEKAIVSAMKKVAASTQKTTDAKLKNWKQAKAELISLNKQASALKVSPKTKKIDDLTAAKLTGEYEAIINEFLRAKQIGLYEQALVDFQLKIGVKTYESFSMDVLKQYVKTSKDANELMKIVKAKKGSTTLLSNFMKELKKNHK